MLGGVKHLDFIQPWEAVGWWCLHMHVCVRVCEEREREGGRGGMGEAQVIGFMSLEDHCGSCV